MDTSTQALRERWTRYPMEKEQGMGIYDLWQHKTSGEKFVTKQTFIDDNTTVADGICGPLHYEEVEQWKATPNGFDYKPEDCEWFGNQDMQHLMTIDERNDSH